MTRKENRGSSQLLLNECSLSTRLDLLFTTASSTRLSGITALTTETIKGKMPAFRDTLRIFTFGVPAGSKERHVDMGSEDPKKGTAVIDILRREG